MTSMTGHGRGEARSKQWTAIVECHSVNRKNAEVVLHADRSAASYEPLVREKTLARIARGRVQVNLTLLPSSDSHAPALIDSARATAFAREARRLASSLDLPHGPTLAHILAAPGVLRQPEPDTGAARSLVLRALDTALDGLCATRAKDGAAARKSLARSLARLRSTIKKITPLAASVPAAQRTALLKRLRSANLPIDPSDPRIATEIALFADRSDVTEELQRAASHLDQFQDHLDASTPVGRTLEFLAQELGREFNTLGSKSPSASIARHVIDAKSELDRIREQLANIE
jgi:uncharacterized protein (TIGR00255 family)